MPNKSRERKVWWYVTIGRTCKPGDVLSAALSPRGFKVHAANRTAAIKKAFQQYRGLANPDGMSPPAAMHVAASATKGPT